MDDLVSEFFFARDRKFTKKLYSHVAGSGGVSGDAKNMLKISESVSKHRPLKITSQRSFHSIILIWHCVSCFCDELNFI